ncbi:MAG: dihydropteroate synthase [Acidobacteria bacterium]|nr:dihydropteroate synthase [Acidobacteriota bacterium]
MSRKPYELELPAGRLVLGDETLVMGVVNVTPDSFSDGGDFLDADRAAEQALRLESEGASIIDIGGESTRPGSEGVSAEVEWSRVGPALEKLRGRLQVPISIDTTKFEVAGRALDLGAAIINDVSGLRFEPRLAELAARRHAGLILMHMRHTPASMQALPFSPDILEEVEGFFRSAVEIAVAAGVAREQLVLDPGIGFGKDTRQNLQLINHLDRFSGLNLPLMVGVSRKSFIGKLLGNEPHERLFGSVGAGIMAALRGAHMVRAHDVKPLCEALRLAEAIARS